VSLGRGVGSHGGSGDGKSRSEEEVQLHGEGWVRVLKFFERLKK
jgi:hypothetical protein